MELQWCDLPIFVLRMHVDGNEKMLTSETFPICLMIIKMNWMS